MAVFYSFHYGRDAWRVQQVVQMGVVEGQPIPQFPGLAAGTPKRRSSDPELDLTTDGVQVGGRCLVGAQTATRRWVLYEISKAWGRPTTSGGRSNPPPAGSTGLTDLPGAQSVRPGSAHLRRHGGGPCRPSQPARSQQPGGPCVDQNQHPDVGCERRTPMIMDLLAGAFEQRARTTPSGAQFAQQPRRAI
jgi:hypothetical protein